MNFKTAIIWSGKLYKLLEKTKFSEYFSPDNLIDTYYPQLASKLQAYAQNEKIAICASNGKKTTLNYLNQILSQNNKTYFTNLIDDKLYPLLTSIILELEHNYSFFSPDVEKNHFTMAFDEYELASAFNSVKFDYLLLSNLFNDQKDFSSLEEKKRLIQDALILNSKLNLIINADDPLFFEIDDIRNDVLLNKKRNKIFWGFNNIEFFDNSETLMQKNDFLICPKCNCALDYRKRFYSHLGYYDCECGFKRPELDISADAKIFADYSFLNVYYNNNKYVFKLPQGGVYNAYNALGAIAIALCLKIERKVITQAFENYTFIKARDEIINRDNKKIKVKIIKNPASLSEAIRELWGRKNTKVVFCLNSTQLDGVDTSWIWDANFEALKGFENKIYAASQRCDDMALRLKYALVNPALITVDASLKNSVQCCFWELEKNENMLVLTTPSLVDEVYDALKK